MPTPFVIKLGEGENRVSIETLAQALENALELLRNVGRDFTPAGVDVRWEVVGASLRSPLTMKFAPRILGAAPPPRGLGERITKATLNGLGQLEERPEPPAHFNEDALRAAQNLVKVVQKDGAKVTVAAGSKHEVTPTAQTIDHVNQVVERAKGYVDAGTVEGRLDEISVHAATSVAVWEELTNYRVECAIDPEMLDEAKTLLGRRVAVTGLIKYRGRKPVSIQVERIRRLRDADELPQAETMTDIDITGGMAPEDFIRKLRDAQ